MTALDIIVLFLIGAGAIFGFMRGFVQEALALMAWLLIILAVFQKYRPKAGLGTLIALMVPYSIALGLIWTALLVLWYFTGAPLGPESPLDYVPGA